MNRITIERPIDDVFAVMTDVERTGTWFPGDVEEHWTSPPPHGIGSTRHAVVTMFGRRQENDAVTTEFDPPHRAAMRGTTSNAPFGPPFAIVYGRMWARGLSKLKQMMEAGEI